MAAILQKMKIAEKSSGVKIRCLSKTTEWQAAFEKYKPTFEISNTCYTKVEM